MHGMHLSKESINVNIKYNVQLSVVDVVLTVGDQDKRYSNNAPHGEFLRSDCHRLRTEVAETKKNVEQQLKHTHFDAIVVLTSASYY